MRVLVLTAAERLPDLTTLYDDLARRVCLDVRRLTKNQQRNVRKSLGGLDLSEFQRIILDLPFKNVYRQTGYLARLNGLLVYEEDACQNYLSRSRWRGTFSRFYRCLPQASILVTGAGVAARLQAEGFNVRFMAKGYDPLRLFVEPAERDIELGFIGRTTSDTYSERKLLLEQLAAAEPLQLLRTAPGEPYRQMLNRIRLFISADVGLGEYMAKNFEAMACGCVVLAWRQVAEETAIGLRDGEHLLLYSSLAELRGHIANLRNDPHLAQRIADAGRTFVETHHGYNHLAEQIAGLLAEPWPAIAPPSLWRALWQRLSSY
jgi:glycosyltransferase involved in cell wall biosynthesis